MGNVIKLHKDKLTGDTGSYFHNNHVHMREGESCIIDGTGSDITVYLNGYAIMPLEEYYKLKGEQMPESEKQKIEHMQLRLDKRECK